MAASGTSLPAGHWLCPSPILARSLSLPTTTNHLPVFVHKNRPGLRLAKSTISHPPSNPLELVGLLKEPYSDVLFRVITNIYTFGVKVGYGFPLVPCFSTCLFKSAFSVGWFAGCGSVAVACARVLLRSIDSKSQSVGRNPCHIKKSGLRGLQRPRRRRRKFGVQGPTTL